MTDFEGRIDKIRTDLDNKIVGSEVKKMLSQHQVEIFAAPPHRQDQNGLVERHWQRNCFNDSKLAPIFTSSSRCLVVWHQTSGRS